MSEYMLLFTIGPVQPFIAQARKTRDLWLGSYLFSIFMEAGMAVIDKEKLVFPTKPTVDGNIPDLPNKYIAIFDSFAEAEAKARETIEEIEKCWEEISKNVRDEILGTTLQGELEEIWNRQVKFANLFETFWVVVKGNPNDYANWLKETQMALDARKRLRYVQVDKNLELITLHPDSLDEGGEKSTISGEREALHGKADDKREDIRKFWRTLIKPLIDAKKLSISDINPDGEERLDAIDTVKRFAYFAKRLKEKSEKFGFTFGYPSTSSIATATFVEKLFKENVDQAVLNAWIWATRKQQLAQMWKESVPYFVPLGKQYTQKENILLRDGDCYFLETFTSQRLKKDYDIPVTEQQVVRDGQKALRDLLKITDNLGITRPTPYYAMIQMDGDRMGNVLKDMSGKEEHREISGGLSEFSREKVPPLVQDQYPGRLVYAGGDDVFALAPLARDYRRDEQGPNEILTLLDLVDRLQKEYRETVSKYVRGTEQKEAVSASIGIAIAHHYTSLSYVRRVSKEAEDAAKKAYGRNALVITVLRRSGEQTRVGCHWRYASLLEEAGQPIKLFSDFYDFFKDDILSPKCVHILLDEVVALVALEKEAQESEIRRVLKRQSDDTMYRKLYKSTEGTPEEKKGFPAADLASRLVALAKAMDKDPEASGFAPAEERLEKYSVELHAEQRRHGLVEVLGWLLVMAFLARKEQD